MKYTHCIECGEKVSKNCKKGHCSKCYDRGGKVPEIKIDEGFSYLIGFAQADGSMSQGTRNRGKFQIQINYEDRNVIKSFGKIIPCKNTVCDIVKSNIKVNGRVYHNKKYSLLRVCNKGFRDFMEECGMPYGNKSKIVKPPLHVKDLSIEDYLRGLYDADGSVDFTAQGFPFLSLTTQSEMIAAYVISYISDVTGRPLKKMSSPKRDDVYNIMVSKENAVAMVKKLYYNNCLSIDRKYKNAQKVKKWVRSDGSKRRDEVFTRWTKEEDKYALSHTIEETMAKFKRSSSGVKMRKLRLALKNRVWR